MGHGLRRVPNRWDVLGVEPNWLCVVAALVLVSSNVNSGEVSVERHERLAATRYNYTSDDCMISLVRRDPGTYGESWVRTDRFCSLNMAAQSGLLAILLAEMKSAGQLDGVRDVGWGGIGNRGPRDLLRRVAVASVNSPAWAALTESKRLTGYSKTPRETVEVVNDPSVFPELTSLLSAMDLRLAINVHEVVVVKRAADVPALVGLPIPSDSVVPLLGVWLELEEGGTAVDGRLGIGVETRDVGFDAVRYSYVSDDCEIGLILRDDGSEDGSILSVEAVCSLDFPVQAGLTGILIAELKNAGRLDGISLIRWGKFKSPNVRRRLALAFHSSPDWAEFTRANTEGLGRVKNPEALGILDRSGVFREFVSLMESIGMGVEVRSELLFVKQAGSVKSLTGVGVHNESLVPYEAHVSFVLRRSGSQGD